MTTAGASSLSDSIRRQAQLLGFFKLRIAQACLLPEQEHLQEWLGQGMHGEMNYLARQSAKRLDPGTALPDARSILVLAMNYYTGDVPADHPLKGRVCRLAWGRDYHELMEERLGKLLDFIRSQKQSIKGVCYADAGPVMEKAWGVRSGLGWRGKHSILITRSHGSWFCLGVIILNEELECDLPERDFCGTCRRCIEACPTKTIVSPYVLDARRCISYLTGGHRGIIPRPLRTIIGNRIFGCDDCQAACPWNRFAVKTAEETFHPGRDNVMPELLDLARLTENEFNLRFEHSSIRWIRREGFLRNVVVALGNSLSAEAVPVLGKALQENSPLIRAHAAWALGRIATDQAFRLLEEAQVEEEESAVLEEMSFSLMRQ
jgi:epoxyqueuosine reductase